MTPERAELLARVTSFDIDGGEVALPFAARLARENGWSHSHADRVVAEYKRFAFLASTGTQPVCPSEDVDAAWHLHLTYTRSYWQRFCSETLGRPLHHDPTRGGPSEGAKHLAMYAHTLATYRDTFGEEPPTDIWPTAERRFGEDTHHRAVNTSRNWVVPKAPVKRVTALALGFAVVAVLVPGCDGGPNPFALGNKDFLTVLFVSLIGAACVGRVVRNVLRKPDPLPEDDTTELDWEQTAYLAGGAPRLTTAAVARVVGCGLAKVDTDGKTLRPNGPVPEDASPVEKAVLKALPVTNEPTALKPVQDAVEGTFRHRAEQMARDGLELPVATRVRIGLAALVPSALVLLCLGVPRLMMGLAAKRPVDHLIIVMAVGAIASTLIVLFGSLRLSKRGAALLARQKERHEALKVGTLWESNGDAGMAVALFGTAILAGTVVAPLQTWYPRQTTEASSSGCGGSGCGSGCGGGDSGGGSGCGGGGCGGGGGD